MKRPRQPATETDDAPPRLAPPSSPVSEVDRPRTPAPDVTRPPHPVHLVAQLEASLENVAFEPVKLPRPPKPQGGRPTELTDAVASKLLVALRYGAGRSVAATFAGAHVKAVERWMRATGEPYLTFQQHVAEAEAHAEMRMLTSIFRGVFAEPKYAFMFLERRYPERWAPPPGGLTTGRKRAPAARSAQPQGELPAR